MCGEEEAAKPADEEMKKAEEPATEEKKESESEAKTETEAPAEKKEETVQEEKKEEAAETIEDKKEEDEEETGEEEGDESAEDTEGKEDADAEDISNLQRSWEMFELAKLVYTKHFNEDVTFKNKRIAECLLKLGEISIEQESYEQAITDIGESIKMQEEQTGEQRDERMLAESYYQLGLAQQFNNQFTEANESYQKSINIVQLRIEKLKGKQSQLGEGADADLEKNSINDEITELEALLPEMNAKLEEVNEQGKESLNLIKEAKECFLNNIEQVKQNGTNGTTDAEVKDITSLVKSKRKISASDETAEVKKTRLSEEPPVVSEENKIEEDQPKEMETETNKENVPAAAPIEQAEKIAVDEPAQVVAETPAPIEEQAPIATA